MLLAAYCCSLNLSVEGCTRNMLTKQHSPVPFFRLAGSLTPTQTLILLPPRLLPQRSMLSQKKRVFVQNILLIQRKHVTDVCQHISHLCLETRPFSCWGGNLACLCLKAGTSFCCPYLPAAGKSPVNLFHIQVNRKKKKNQPDNYTFNF